MSNGPQVYALAVFLVGLTLAAGSSNDVGFESTSPLQSVRLELAGATSFSTGIAARSSFTTRWSCGCCVAGRSTTLIERHISLKAPCKSKVVDQFNQK